MGTLIEFNPEMLERFKQAYSNCKTDTFMFEGNEFVKDYAKYMIQYLEPKLLGET